MSTGTLVQALGLMVIVSLTAIAQAYPDLFNIRYATNCTSHPTTDFGDHGAPVQDEDISFILEPLNEAASRPQMDSMAAFSVCPGYTYKVTVNTGREAKDTLLTASIGKLKASKEKECPNRSIGKEKSRTYNDELIVPCDITAGNKSLELKVTAAGGRSDNYHQASALYPLDSLANCPHSTCTAGSKTGAAAKPASPTQATTGNSTAGAWQAPGPASAALADGAAALAGQTAGQPAAQQPAAPAVVATGGASEKAPAGAVKAAAGSATDAAAAGVTNPATAIPPAAAATETPADVTNSTDAAINADDDATIASDPAAAVSDSTVGVADPAAGTTDSAEGDTDIAGASDATQGSTMLGSDFAALPAAAGIQDSAELIDALGSPPVTAAKGPAGTTEQTTAAAADQDSGLGELASILAGGSVNTTEAVTNSSGDSNDTLSTWADAWGGNSSAANELSAGQLANDIPGVQATAGRPNSGRPNSGQGFWSQLFGLLVGRRPSSGGSQGGNIFSRPSQGGATSPYGMQPAYGADSAREPASSSFGNVISAADNAAAAASRPRRDSGARKLLQATATTTANPQQQMDATLGVLGLGTGRQTAAALGDITQSTTGGLPSGNSSTPLLDQFVRAASEARAARLGNNSTTAASSPSASDSILSASRPGAGLLGGGLSRNASIMPVNGTSNSSMAIGAFPVLRAFQRLFGTQRDQSVLSGAQQQASAFGGPLQAALAGNRP